MLKGVIENNYYELYRIQFCLSLNSLRKSYFYLSAVDDQLRAADDNPSIGLILCKDKDRLDVEYALRDINKPMGVSSFITKDIPLSVQSQLPTIQEIENELTALIHNDGNKPDA